MAGRYAVKNNQVNVLLITLSQSNGAGQMVGSYPTDLLGLQGGVFDAALSAGSITVTHRFNWTEPSTWGFHDYIMKQLVAKYDTPCVLLNAAMGGTGVYFQDPTGADWNILSTTGEGSAKPLDERLLDRTKDWYDQMKTIIEGAGYTMNVKIVSVIGEADSSSTTTANVYENNATDSIAWLRTNLSLPNVEIISVRVHNNFDPARVGNSTVRTAQANIAAADTLIEFITDSDTWSLQVDNTHYDASGYSDMSDAIYALF